MDEITIGNIIVPSWILLPLIFLVWVMALMFLKRVSFAAIRRLAATTRTKVDDIFIKSADAPLTFIIFASGGAVIEPLVPAAIPTGLTHYFPIIFKAAAIVSLVVFMEQFLSNVIHEYSGRVEILRSSGGIIRGFMRVLVVGLGLLVLLDSFGVSVTPVLASLGIGSLAVALALQPTLENFFAGVQIVIDKPIQAGHFIKLESGEEGYVHKIGWRSTWIRLLPDNMAIISNKNLVNARIINYYYPGKELAVLAEVSVHYQSDLEQVERVTTEAAKEVLQEASGGVKNFQPVIRYHTFGESGIHFSVILRAKEFADQYLIKHEFIKKLHKRYRAEGIVIPYPVRATNYDQEKAVPAADGQA